MRLPKLASRFSGGRARPAQSKVRPVGVRLALEHLETREVPAVFLRQDLATDAPNNVPLYIPLTATNTPDGPVTYTVSSNNADYSAELLPGATSLVLNVTGTNSQGQPFSGQVTLRLFTDVAPLATQTIIQLANDGFYNGKLFHRVLDGFVAQGGSPNGDGIGGSSLPDVVDEFNAQYTFASAGIVAMANAKDDNNNSQFFITDIDTPLIQRPQFLNFNHSIVGILTDGFEIFDQIMTTPVTNAGGEVSRPINPVTITSATVIEDKTNAVVKLTPRNNVSGTVTISATGSDGSGVDGSVSFDVNVLPVNVDQNLQVVNSRAFLNPLPTSPVIAKNSPGSFTISATDIDGDQLTYAVGVPGNLLGQPANATVSVDQATGVVTVTPNTDFVGDIQLLIGVRDQTNRASSPNDPGNFDTDVITVRVQEASAPTGSLVATRTTVGINQTTLLTARFTATGSTPVGTVQFYADETLIGTSNLVNGESRFSTTFSTVGVKSIRANFVPANSLFEPASAGPLALTVSAEAPEAIPLTATGAAAGEAPRVVVRDQSGTERFNFLAFDEAFTGGVRVAVADVTGDGQDDIVVVPGFGGAPIIQIYSGANGALVQQQMIFEDTFRGGLFLDVGDVYGKGYSQIAVGAGFTGGPRVSLFDAVQNKVLLNYFAYDSTQRSGVAVDLADLEGGGKLYIITGPGKGAPPIVNVYAAQRDDGFPVPEQQGKSFFAVGATEEAGIRVGASALINNVQRNILVGPAEPESAALDLVFDPSAVGVFVD